MELVIFLAYVVLGAAVGLAIACLSKARGKTIGTEGRLIEMAAGALSSVVVYLLSTSVWAYRAASERVPGTTLDPITHLNLFLWDHPIVCAVAISASASLLCQIVLSVRSGTRRVT